MNITVPHYYAILQIKQFEEEKKKIDHNKFTVLSRQKHIALDKTKTISIALRWLLEMAACQKNQNESEKRKNENGKTNTKTKTKKKTINNQNEK